MEGRGFSPAAEFSRDLGALAPEARQLQGLKAHSTLRSKAAGLKPRPSEGHKLYRLLIQLSTSLFAIAVVGTVVIGFIPRRDR